MQHAEGRLQVHVVEATESALRVSFSELIKKCHIKVKFSRDVRYKQVLPVHVFRCR